MKKLGALIIGLTVSLVYPNAAQARIVEYLSQHPVPHKFGGGFCTIDVPHVHNYPPTDPRMYRETNGQFYFVGDPAPFDYDGPRYAYYGAHPVAEAEVHFGHRSTVTSRVRTTIGISRRRRPNSSYRAAPIGMSGTFHPPTTKNGLATP